jgi:hypothetical protein
LKLFIEDDAALSVLCTFSPCLYLCYQLSNPTLALFPDKTASQKAVLGLHTIPAVIL